MAERERQTDREKNTENTSLSKWRISYHSTRKRCLSKRKKYAFFCVIEIDRQTKRKEEEKRDVRDRQR